MGLNGRSKTLVRALAIRRLLLARRHTLHELAAQFHVAHRTIRRDVYALEAAGEPVAHTPDSGEGRMGEWWITDHEVGRVAFELEK